jgi:isoquinoline 1-oxidoreductase alpha subunit
MELSINEKTRVVSSQESSMLLWVLRDELGMTGTKFGCGAGICGACTVIVDGVATRSCITPISTLAGKQIKTIEGLANGDALHPVQQAFVDAQVPQCGWCMSGQIMTAAAFLEATPNASAEQIDDAMNKNYCRCGCYHRIRAAVNQAAAAIAPTGEVRS